MVRTEIKTSISCDFCGNEFIKDIDNPIETSRIGEFRLYFNVSYVVDPITNKRKYVELGEAYGHMCPSCQEQIYSMLNSNKNFKKTGDSEG